jgi:FHS family glucose/mannose:H+ symporter-like MFS transporter
MNIRHKLIIPTAALSNGMCGAYLAMYQISLLRIAQALELSNFMMGVIVALQFAALCLPPLFLGALCERIGRRGVVMISMPLMILGTFLVSVTSGLAFFVLGILLIGAGFSVTQGTMIATLGVEFGERSTLLLGVSQATYSLGSVLSPLACEALFLAGFTYNALFGIISAIYLALFALFLLTKQQRDVKGVKGAGVGSALKFFTRRAFVILAAAMLLYVATEATLSFFADSYFKLTLRSPETSALSLSLFWAGMIPTRLLLGTIKRKYKEVVIGCAAGIIICILAILLIPAAAAKTAAYCALGAFCGPCWPLIVDMTVKKYRQSAGTVSNLMISVGSLGGAVMPLLAGALIAGADFTPIFIIAIACAALMAALFIITGRKEQNAGQAAATGTIQP